MAPSRRMVVALAAVALVGAGAAVLVSRKPARTVHVLAATSLGPSFAQIARSFEAAHPGVEVDVELGGSLLLARRLQDLHAPCDLVAMADAEVFDQVLVPGKIVSGYHVLCGGRLGIVYRPQSRFANEIDEKNWFDVLARPGVNVGRADPDVAPAGYRTLVLFELAEKHYARPGLAAKLRGAAPDRFVRGNLSELAALVQAGELDYSFDYEASARAAHLEFLRLPAEIDESDRRLADAYGVVKVQVKGKAAGETLTVSGSPIRYGIAVPAGSKEAGLAAELLSAIAGPAGRSVLEAHGFIPYDDPIPPAAMHPSGP